MEPVSTVTTFLGLVKATLNFTTDKNYHDLSKKMASNSNLSDRDREIISMAQRLVLNKPKANSSITKLLEKSIAHYPLVVSNNITDESAIELSRINEGRIAEYIKIILQTDRSIVDLDAHGGDFSNFLGGFKANNAFRMVDVDELVKEGFEFNDIYNTFSKHLLEENINYLFEVSSSDKIKAAELLLKGAEKGKGWIDQNSKNKSTNTENIRKKNILNNEIINLIKKKDEVESELNNNTGLKANERNNLQKRQDTIEKEIDNKSDRLNQIANVATGLSSITLGGSVGLGISAAKVGLDLYKDFKDGKQKEIVNAEKKFLADIIDRNVKISKSANQTVPTIIEAEVTLVKGSSQAIKKVNMAVKSMLHLIPGNEMMDAIAGRVAKGDFLTKVIKWYTGEISFIRDLFLNVDEIKRIEGGTSNKGQTAIDKMFDFTNKSTFNAIVNGEEFIPTTTLAISIDDVSYLKTISGINLLSEMDAKRVMKDLGLLAIMVVDELKDTLHVFDDGLYTSFEVFSLSAKSKEEKNQSKLMQALLGSKKV
jgi:hypothetical protein